MGTELTKKYATVGSVPPGTLFRLGKSGTLYFKAKDGSIRNVDKAARRLGLDKETKQSRGKDKTTNDN